MPANYVFLLKTGVGTVMIDIWRPASNMICFSDISLVYIYVFMLAVLHLDNS